VGIILSTLQLLSPMSKRARSATIDVDASPRLVVTATDVCVHYGSVVALAPSTLVIAAGTSTALVGPNGSGKSTLLGLLAGLVRPTAGSVTVADGVRIGFVAQQQHQHRWMPLSVEDVLRMGRYGQRGLLGRLGAADHAAIADAARRLDVAELRRRPFGDLSGGQRQRVLVAQALTAAPDLLLLDEPITGLDLASQERILEIIATETAAGMAVVLSTHHLGEARRTDRVLLLAGCVLAAGPPADVLQPRLLAEAFSNRLVTSGAATVVVDEHGHAHDGCPDGDSDAADLLPQHEHDHHAHGHPGAPT
jgi:iron complex transport system ATP-binding protein